MNYYQIKVSFFRCRDLVIIKLQEDGKKKVGVQEQSGYQFKNTAAHASNARKTPLHV
jgi:hypothetical protein